MFASATVNTSLKSFRDARRVQHAMTSSLERKVLLWLAARTPDYISPDQLTALGFAAQFFAAAFFIAVNWLGDSLDGTLARHRNRLRPRYGFYVDHMSDTFGAIFLMAGLGFSGFLHWQVAGGMLVCFLVLSVESYLTTYTLGTFRMSHGLFGPTEIRILLIVGSAVLVYRPHAQLLGREFLLFDIGGAIAIAGMLGMAIISTAKHTFTLYREGRLS
jgi:archaetidylinositol phosphate synthase